MNDNARAFEAYVYATTEQLEQHQAGLDELRDTLIKRPLSFNEKSAAERSLQVITEVAIGCSKHFLKMCGKPVPSEARATIECVYELTGIIEPAIETMRGAVGMRNAIVHDYLNLDWSLLDRVLREGKYADVVIYARAIASRLLD